MGFRPNIQNMHLIRLPTLREPTAFKDPAELSQLSLRQQYIPEGFNIIHISRIKLNAVRHNGFEFSNAREANHVMKLRCRQAQQVRQSADMPSILLDGILKSVFFTVKHLGPFAVVRRTEYPSFVIFGFDHKNSEFRQDDMIDLRNAA